MMGNAYGTTRNIPTFQIPYPFIPPFFPSSAAKCLVSGEEWEAGFKAGLNGSRLIVYLIRYCKIGLLRSPANCCTCYAPPSTHRS